MSSDDLSTIADTLRGAFPEYEPAKLDAKGAAYLEALKLPKEVEDFLRALSPAQVVGTTSLLLSIEAMREEHNEMAPSKAVRNAGASVIATANGNPYFVVRKGKGYEIRIVDHEDINEDDDDLDELIDQSSAGPVFTSLVEFIGALAAQVLPSSPHSDGSELARFELWRARRAKGATAPRRRGSKAAVEVVPFFVPRLPAGMLVTGITVTGAGEIYLCGGRGANMCHVSTDRGETFRPIAVAPGTGLRSILVEGRTIFVCGERGLFARSTDAGKTFKRIDIGAEACLQTVLRAEGALWTTGDPGTFRSRDDGKTWERVSDVEGEVSRPKASVHGLLLPTSQGRLYICRGGKIQRTPLSAKTPLWAACASPEGTIIVVGKDGVIERSDDGGKRFQRIEAPGSSQSLQNVECTEDGRFVVVGSGGTILRSVDDGQSFQRAKQRFANEWVFGAARFDGRILVGTDRGLVLAVG